MIHASALTTRFMISLHENYLPINDQIAKEYQKLVDLTFRAAIMEKCGGVLPSVEEMAARGKCVVTSEGVRLLLWDHPPLGYVDMNYVIAKVEAPK